MVSEGFVYGFMPEVARHRRSVEGEASTLIIYYFSRIFQCVAMKHMLISCCFVTKMLTRFHCRRGLSWTQA